MSRISLSYFNYENRHLNEENQLYCIDTPHDITNRKTEVIYPLELFCVSPCQQDHSQMADEF